MPKPDTDRIPAAPDGPALIPATSADPVISADDFRASFGEDLQRTLDIRTWVPGDLSQEYSRIEQEVREAVQLESQLQRNIRKEIFPLLKTAPRAPKGAGVYGPIDTAAVAKIHQGLLFNGGVEACDGTHTVHDT